MPHMGQQEPNLWEVKNRTSMLITLSEAPGMLNKALNILTSNKINMTRISSRPSKFIVNNWRQVDFFIDMEGNPTDTNVKKALDELKLISDRVTEVGTPEVPWFPTRIEDFNFIGNKVLGEGNGIQEVDHPSFRDPVYRKRREFIASHAFHYNVNDADIPSIKYTEEEISVWKHCYPKLKALLETNACDETNEIIHMMEQNVEGFSSTTIPQLDPISKYLQSQTGWRLKPVGGLLTQREFLNGLAFKIFHSTQYIRHHSTPEYTPEPDIIHELVGHAPMFANQDFADFSQEIGLASLGASEIELKRLAAIYWFTVEFGMCLDKNGNKKAYGAGIMSSFGELAYCVTDEPKFKPFDPYVIAQDYVNFPISEMQPVYFVAESFSNAKSQIIDYCESISRPFNLAYNQRSDTIEVDRKIKTREEKLEENQDSTGSMA